MSLKLKAKTEWSASFQHNQMRSVLTDGARQIIIEPNLDRWESFDRVQEGVYTDVPTVLNT